MFAGLRTRFKLLWAWEMEHSIDYGRCRNKDSGLGQSILSGNTESAAVRGAHWYYDAMTSEKEICRSPSI